MNDIAINFAGYWNLIVKVVSLLILILAIIYTWLRAGSLHFLRDKIWLISSLKRKFSDDQLNKQWNEIRDIEMLRFKMGLPFSHKEDLNDLMQYLKPKGISTYEIISLSNYFDLKNKKFKDFSYEKWAKIFLTIAALLTIAGSCFFITSEFDTVWLKIKKTGTSISYSGNEIKINNTTITKDICGNSNMSLSVNSDDKVVACQLLDEGATLYKKFLKEQKYTLMFFGFLLFSVGLFFIRKTQEINKVLEISKRLNFQNKVDVIS